MNTLGPTRWLTEFCHRHRFLHGLLDPLHAHAEKRGYRDLARANALRLLERAHVERLRGDDARETSEKALDRFAALASQGDAEAAFHVAEAHRTGFGRPFNHWKALEHYRLALDLGHPEAGERLRQLEAREEVRDDAFEAFGRRALLKATYARKSRSGALLEAHASFRQRYQDGLGLRGVLVVFGLVGLVLAYLATDLYFFGLGGWRPDPARVVWGMFGKIHPPKDDSVGRVLPGWLRPDVRSVALRVNDYKRELNGPVRISDFQGKVVYLQVVEGRHPAVAESVPYLKALDERRASGLVFFLVYRPNGIERESDANDGVQWALDFAPAFPVNPKALRPLGDIRTFPMNFVIDRHGRIRQRWTGFSEAITEKAIQGALAES